MAAEQLFEPDSCGRIGFPAYALQNNNANIRRMKQRLDQLKKLATAEQKEYSIAHEVMIEEDPAEVRIRIHFPDKPERNDPQDIESVMALSGVDTTRLGNAISTALGNRRCKW